MTAARFYSSTSGSMELQADITDTSTTIQVDSTVGLPGTTPFTLVIDPGSTEEIVDCTGVAGTSLTVTRGVDGSPAQAHVAGATVRHMATARDFREIQEHIGTTAAHGTSGNVVGTTDTQALSNKDLTSGTNTFPSSLATDAELAAHSGATVAHGATGSVVGTDNNQALINKDLSSPTNTFPSSLTTDTELASHTTATSGVHGVSGNVVGETNTQALTNKNLTSGTNTFPSTLVDTTTSSQTLSRDLVTGDVTSNVSRVFRVRRLALVGTKQYQATWYVQSGDTNGNSSMILEENGVEVARVNLKYDGNLQVVNGDILANNIPTSGVAGTSTSKAKKRLHWGVASVTANGSGVASFSHGAGFTPSVVQIYPLEGYQMQTNSIGSSTITVTILQANGTVYPSASATIHYICGE